jgi:hypothetical protein
MKSAALGVAFIALSGLAFGQDSATPSHERTSLPASARFQILQSPLAAKWTFRLDKYSGRVWQLVKTRQDDNTWEEMPVINLPKVSSPPKPRFQLFTSGLAARHTFLLDSDTGKTWMVVSGKRKRSDGTQYDVNAWQPFEE